MKRKPAIITIAAIAVLALACAAVFLYERSRIAMVVDDEATWDLRDASPQKKVIITDDGKGIVSLTDFGMKPAFAAPDSLSAIVGELLFERGYCPEPYACKGYRDGWFAIEINGNTGYIRQEYVSWDAIDSF